MKYFSKVLVVLIVALGVAMFAFSSQYRDHREKEKITLTTVNIDQSKTTEKKNTRKLVAENKEGNYKLYMGDGTVTLTHDGKEQSFDTWYTYVSTCEPKLYYGDFDFDKKNELAIILENYSTTDFNSGDDYSNTLIVIKPIEDVVVPEGKVIDTSKPFRCYIASVDTWKRPFNNSIRCEMSQPKINNKYIQFVMDNVKTPIKYDEKTGLTENKHVYYALAPKLSDGNYATYNHWTRGNTRYSVDKDGNIVLEIQVMVLYNELEKPQNLGTLKMNIWLKRPNYFDIVHRTIVFDVNDKYYCTDPREKASESWSSVIINNAYASSETEKSISWVEAQFALDSPYQQTSISFAGMDSQIKNVDRVELSEKDVTLYAKDGYTFSKKPSESGKLSVIINSGKKTQYDISDSCKITKEDGKSKLVITFDKTYNRDELKGIIIKYGA